MCGARDGRAVDPQLRLRGRLGRGPGARRGQRSPAHRGRKPPRRPRRRGSRGPGRPYRRVRHHIQPGGGPALRHPHGRHHRARLRARPSRRAGCVRCSARRTGHGLHLPGRHLRRAGGNPPGGGRGRPGHRRGAHRQRQPARGQHPGPCPARRPRRGGLPHCGLRGPRRVQDRRTGGGRRPHRRLPGGHQHGYRLGPPHRVSGLQAGRHRRLRRRRRAPAGRWEALAGQDHRRRAQGCASHRRPVGLLVRGGAVAGGFRRRRHRRPPPPGGAGGRRRTDLAG